MINTKELVAKMQACHCHPVEIEMAKVLGFYVYLTPNTEWNGMLLDANGNKMAIDRGIALSLRESYMDLAKTFKLIPDPKAIEPTDAETFREARSI